MSPRPVIATLKTVPDLIAAGLAPQDAGARLDPVATRYAVAISPAMVARIDTADARDPIAAQFVPTPLELVETAAERADPIGDDVHAPVPGIVHRYRDRVLLKPLHVCPVYCRFCFRREVVGPGSEMLDDAGLDRALAYIAGDPDIFEVILTGGDPLMLSARRLAALMARLAAIPHVGTIRIHSRVPAVSPDLIDDARLAALSSAKPVWIAVHTNHVRELGPEARAAIARLHGAGLGLVSQTVLLRGVNADGPTLADLFRTLVTLRVKPYYLHHGDLARGTGHFRTTIAEGLAIDAWLARHLTSLARPAYVIDIPGGHGKVPVTPDHVRPVAGGWLLTDRDGGAHFYAE